MCVLRHGAGTRVTLAAVLMKAASCAALAHFTFLRCPGAQAVSSGSNCEEEPEAVSGKTAKQETSGRCCSLPCPQPYVPVSTQSRMAHDPEYLGKYREELPNERPLTGSDLLITVRRQVGVR